jgi:citrate synthase
MLEPSEWISAREATRRLAIKPQSLYAYVSRGLVRSVKSTSGRGRRYSADDVQRLKVRHDARSGHAAVAASALRWGEPVLETSISEIRPDGPYYRGIAALELLRQGVSFERASEWLWTETMPSDDELVIFQPLKDGPRERATAAETEHAIVELARLAATLSATAAWRSALSEDVEVTRARMVIPWLASRVRGNYRPAPANASTAQRLLISFGRRAYRPAISAVDRALLLCADHELNASTFAARVAASAGASLVASLGAALHTLSGALHGGMCERVEAMLTEARALKHPADVVSARLSRGEYVPGYGHALYPNGDPRAHALLEIAETLRPSSRDYKAMSAIHRTMHQLAQTHPSLDAGLVTLSCALGLPRGAASAIFATGRLSGWVAHILEQRRQGFLLRPRARYVEKIANE